MTITDHAAHYASLQLASLRARLDAQLRRSAGAAHADDPALASIERELLASRDDDTLPARWLRTRLALSETEEQILWLLMGYEVSAEIRGMVMTLAGARDEMTIDLAERIVYGEASARGWRELGSDGALVQLGLIRSEGQPVSGLSRHRSRIGLVPRARGLLHGDAQLSDELRELARYVEHEIPLAEVVTAAGVSERVARELGKPRPFIIATGADGAGRATLLRAAAICAGTTVIDVSCARLATAPDALSAQLRVIAREARLFRAAVLLRDYDVLATTDVVAWLVDRILVDGTREPILATAATRTNRGGGARHVVEVKLPPLDGTRCAELWQRAVPMASDDDARYLSSTHPLSPSMIHAVGRRLAETVEPAPTGATVNEAIRFAIDDRLSGLAQRVEVTQSWDDLVLPEDQLDLIRELLARVRERRLVYEQWGFSTKLGKGLGVSALFSGPPGTGKTMAASLVAKDLGLQLYRVDLAQMVSKWIGETEKNLAQLFDAAESAHAVLLFDEADSLFGKRTEVKSSNDRYANLEVNYMLQRLETFTGICLLTTNHENAIDDAFRRRLAFHVRFPIPDEPERAALWRAMIPESAPLASSIDFTGLARRLELPGGHIRNAALRAAFLAAAARSPITMDHLWHAAAIECEAMGKIVPSRASTL
ncbi:MAG: ATP-binding protein [Deltaproteobacteria bacterium]|nr:ATP-binding protein [Deltaproteobacteria bacterium]